MKHMLLSVCAACAVCAFFVALSFSAAQTSKAMSDLGVLVQEKCVSCHGLAKTCTNLGKDEAWWKITVDRMVKRGADLDESQAEQITVYLAAPCDDFLKACGK